MLKTIPLYHLELVRDRSIPFVSLETAEQCAEILHELLDHSPVEQLLVMHMDAQFNLVGVEKVGLGSTLGVSVVLADIFRGAIAAAVPFIVLGHNHPGNSLTPSNADYDLTDKAMAMGRLLGVEVMDHIIITPTGKHLSMKEEDLKNTKYVFTLDDGSEVEVAGDEEIEYDGEKHSAANLYDALKEGYYGKF
jgi:DNA repair protein RadC